jgi:hypothetical protein
MMGEDYNDIQAQTRKALQIVRVWEVYVKVDMDDDGVAELFRIVYGDGTGVQNDTPQSGAYVVLGLEAVDEAPYAEVVWERDPHQFEGHSTFEDTYMVQRVKTAILRSALDNVYAQNRPRPIIDSGAVENPEDILINGKALIVKDGRNAREAVNWETVPFVADHAREFLDYMDQVVKDRTGITDASGGLDPEKLQNTSATAAVMMNESGVAQADGATLGGARGAEREAGETAERERVCDHGGGHGGQPL